MNKKYIRVSSALEKMIPVYQNIEILEASLMPRENLKDYDEQILVKDAFGRKYIKNKLDIVNNYRYMNGRRINLLGWRQNSKYLIQRRVNVKAKAVKIPSQYNVKLPNRLVNNGNKNGNYIVVYPDNENEVLIISSKLFNKIFSISLDDIQNFRTQIKKVKVRNSDNNGDITGKVYDRIFNTSLEDMQNQSKRVKVERGIKGSNNTAININGKTDTDIENKVEYSGNFKYTAIGVLVNKKEQIVGFILRNKNGDTFSVNKRQLMAACHNHLVSNIMLSNTSSNGKYYLRGNGIRISDLPKTLAE